jgi:hypothetical protein
MLIHQRVNPDVWSVNLLLRTFSLNSLKWINFLPRRKNMDIWVGLNIDEVDEVGYV